jgi:hypothetical protein
MRLKSAPLDSSRERSQKIADIREDVGGGSESKEQPIHNKKPTDLSMGGEGREGQRKSLSWMFGKDTHITCGDLTLISRKRDTMNLTQRQKSAES